MLVVTEAHGARRRSDEARAARAARAEALRAALGLSAIDVFQRVRELAGEAVSVPPKRTDYSAAARWFNTAPPNEALVWLELKAREAGLPIAQVGGRAKR